MRTTLFFCHGTPLKQTITNNAEAVKKLMTCVGKIPQVVSYHWQPHSTLKKIFFKNLLVKSLSCDLCHQVPCPVSISLPPYNLSRCLCPPLALYLSLPPLSLYPSLSLPPSPLPPLSLSHCFSISLRATLTPLSPLSSSLPPSLLLSLSPTLEM